MSEIDFRELEKLFLALGDKTRLRLLASMADGPVSVGFLADTLGDSQPKVSRHLAYLRNANVVDTTRDGKWIYYGIRDPEDVRLKEILDRVVRSLTTEQVEKKTVRRTKKKPVAKDKPPPNEIDMPAPDEQVFENVSEEYFAENETAENDVEDWSDRAEEMDIFLL